VRQRQEQPGNYNRGNENEEGGSRGVRNAASSVGWKDNTWVWENDGVNIVITQKGQNNRDFAIDVKDGGNVKRVVEANCART
jgi:hypothetical protein